MTLIVLPKTLVAHTDAVATDVMANFNALASKINGELDAENLAASIRQALHEAGDIKASGRAAAPTGWLMCEGQAISRATFAALFAAISTAYGAGDGVTTFNVPDLRGRVPVGVDGAAGRLSANDARGQSGGQEMLRAHAHQIAFNTSNESTAHAHTMPYFETTRHEGSGFAYTTLAPGGTASATNFNDRPHLHAAVGGTGVVGQGAQDERQMPPFQVVNYMIKT
jgi:microcystin-dependent protein